MRLVQRTGSAEAEQQLANHRLASSSAGSTAEPPTSTPSARYSTRTGSGASGSGPLEAAEPEPKQRQCKSCRKIIGAAEPFHKCSACQLFVCEDCSSYTSEQVSVA